MVEFEQRLVTLAAAILTGELALAGLLLVFQAVLLTKASELRQKGSSYKRLIWTGNAAIICTLLTAVVAALRVATKFSWGGIFLLMVLSGILVVAMAFQAYKITTSD